ncbi:MAG: DUF3536 domain-containing protein [Bryobacteraceae bacterium]
MKYLCIHSHFYQPPRENPWLEAIELQDSAYPYHDWNERINAECYATNGASRVLDSENRILQIVNNYSRISYNFGPTLLSWLQEKAPGTYRSVLEADRESAVRFSGHGSAIAQAYNHIIMPLANRRDKITQIRWGIRDFMHRFQRPPEGMWLPETAVDNESLEIMAEHGIKFTILAPYQARRVRRLGGRSWRDTAGGRIDPTMPYRVKLPAHSIDVFFYDGPTSRAVAFERLLENGERFAHRLLDSVTENAQFAQLAHIATDGETYGHHHRHGEMALSYALGHIESNRLAQLTNYGEFLELHPPTYEAEIYENTAWSCSHGVERWISNCGCNSGGRPGWNQEWRRPLREAFDWLRDRIAPTYEGRAGLLLGDPWAARNDYIQVVLDRKPESKAHFLRQHAIRALAPEEEVQVWKLLEMQRHAMLMYTSCGWFFDELSGIETVQVIQYAGRVVQLAEELFGEALEEGFLERLSQAKSNLAEEGDGRKIYEKSVRPAMVDLRKVGAHYAISSMFEREREKLHVYCYQVEPEDFKLLQSGSMKLALGRARFTSDITQESDLLTFGVLHFGDHNLAGGVRTYQGGEHYESMVADIRGGFARADVPEVLRQLDSGFGKNVYSLKTMFKDEQRRITQILVDSSLDDAGDVFRQLYDRYAPMMSFLADLAVPLPKALQNIAEYAINSRLRRAVLAETLELERMQDEIQEASSRRVEIDSTTLEFAIRKRLEKLAEQVEATPGNVASLRSLRDMLGFAASLPFKVSLWGVQNSCFRLLTSALPYYRRGAGAGASRATEWVAVFSQVCAAAGVLIAPSAPRVGGGKVTE